MKDHSRVMSLNLIMKNVWLSCSDFSFPWLNVLIFITQCINNTKHRSSSGADPGFQVKGGGGGAHLKKLHRAEGGAKIFGVFCVKNYDLTQFFFFFFPILGGGGGGGGGAPGAPPLDLPLKLDFGYYAKITVLELCPCFLN